VVDSLMYEGKIPIPFENESIEELVWKKKKGTEPEFHTDEMPLGYRIYFPRGMMGKAHVLPTLGRLQ